MHADNYVIQSTVFSQTQTKSDHSAVIFYPFRYPEMVDQIFPDIYSPNHHSTACLNMAAIYQPLITASIWTIWSCSAPISALCSLRIVFIYIVRPTAATSVCEQCSDVVKYSNISIRYFILLDADRRSFLFCSKVFVCVTKWFLSSFSFNLVNQWSQMADIDVSNSKSSNQKHTLWLWQCY